MNIIEIVSAIFVSMGFWNYILYKVQRRDSLKDKKLNKNTDTDLLIMGVACHLIKQECEAAIEKGSITTEEYNELHKYLYVPYSNKGGNGTAKRLMEAVEKLPIVN